MEENILDFNSALDLLNNVSESFIIDVRIPSLGRNVSFKAIDAKQQKEILGTAIDNDIYNFNFIKTFYNILKTNILNDDPLLVDEFTVADKTAVAFALRNQISNEINVTFDEKNKISQKFELSDVLLKFEHYQLPDIESAHLNNDQFTIEVTLKHPTIKNELDYDDQIQNIKKSNDVKTNEDVKRIISNAFIGEITKYIANINVNGNDIIFSQLNYKQQTQIVEKLPSTLIQNILEIISKWKNDLEALTTFEYDDYKRTIAVDSLLFLN